MKLQIFGALSGIITLLAAPAEENAEEAKLEALEASATAFVEAYNQADAEAISGLYLPTGELVLASGEIVSGREAIKEFYDEIFSAGETSQAAIEAGSVRFVTPGIAVEDGTLHITAPSGEVTSHFYTAIQVLQENGKWLTASVRDELQDHAPASEKLIPLAWLVGDWTTQIGGATTSITFDWSEDGPFIDGRALTEKAGVESTASTYRIGWDSRRKGYVSWAFDAQGGFNHSEWTLADENGWLLRTKGVTADGEGNQGTQRIQVDPAGQSFLWSTRDQIINNEIQAEGTITIVRRPPPPASAALADPAAE